MKKTIALLLTIFLLTTEAIAVPKLSSYPAAPATIFLDFDGHYVQSTVWNGGNSFYCAPSGLTDPQITEVFNGTPSGSTVDMRSVPLSGFHDLGENGRRVEEFLLALDQQITLMLRAAPQAPAADAEEAPAAQ